MHIRVECPRLRQVVEIHLFEELHFLHFLRVLKGLPRLRVEVVGVVERTFVVGGDIVLHFGRALLLLVVRRGDGEVGGVVEHIALLRLDVHLHVRYRERGALLHGVRHAFHGVALLLGLVGVERLLQFDICVQRVIIGR